MKWLNWRGLISVVGWLSDENYQRWIPNWLIDQDPSYRRLAIVASIIHRQDPASALIAALDDPESCFQARALRAVGELKRRDLLPLLTHQFKSNDEACRFWVAWSAVLLGDPASLDVLKTFATAKSPFLKQILHLMLRVIDLPSAINWLNDFSKNSEVLRDAVLGVGIIGDPRYVPWLIKVMVIPEVARVAGEAFSMITGVDFADDDLEGEWPEGFAVGPTENPADEDVAMDADEDLPWLEPNLIQAWWDKNNNAFQANIRYFVGKPITETHCQQVLKTGLQRQRRAAALALALFQPDVPLFNTVHQGFGSKEWARNNFPF